MAKLNRSEASAVKGLMREEGWEVILRLVASKLDEWNEREVTGENEFQTLRELHSRNGRVEGLKEFFNDLETKAFND